MVKMIPAKSILIPMAPLTIAMTISTVMIFLILATLIRLLELIVTPMVKMTTAKPTGTETGRSTPVIPILIMTAFSMIAILITQQVKIAILTAFSMIVTSLEVP